MAKIPSPRDPDEPFPGGGTSNREQDLSPFAPRPADAEAESDSERELASLPPARDIDQLRTAASAMLSSGIPLDEAAGKYSVDADTLHLYYRTYVKFYGKENLNSPGEFTTSDEDFDRTSRRQFDRNWAEMMFQAEKNRPQLSPLRRKLMRFPLTGWMFNGPFIDRVAVTGAICILLLGFLAFKLTRGHRGEDRPPASTAPPPRAPSQGIHELSREQEQALFDEVVEFLRMFVELETWEQRLPYVRDRDNVATKMERFHARYPDGPLVPVVVSPEMILIDREDGEFALTHAKWNQPYLRSDRLEFFIELTGGEPKFLVDWEALFNYEPTPWEDFKSSRSSEPAPFRVRVELGDYYNTPFLDKDVYAGYQLHLPGRPEEEVFAFAERGSEACEVIGSALASELDRNQRMILDLSYPEGARFDNILKIEGVASPHW